MAETTTTQIVREAPEIEAYKAGIYQDSLDYIKRLQGIDPVTNQQILDTLEIQGIRPGAGERFDRFCVAFNAVLPHIQYLHQCTRNPFIDASGHGIDLSMGVADQPTLMDRNTPLCFAVPESLS